jgi:hypothetical protein
MSNDLIAAINVMRNKLDELERMVNALPGELPSNSLTSGYTPGPRFHDWCDINGIVRDYDIRRRLFDVAKLMDEGLTIDQVIEHRSIRRKKTLHPFLAEFCEKWGRR